MESICYGNDLTIGISIVNYQKVTEFHSYRHTDLVPDKCGVEPVIKGWVNEFKPWYYDGKTVWWGTLYPLRSEAEAAALKLQKQFKLNSNDNSNTSKIQE